MLTVPKLAAAHMLAWIIYLLVIGLGADKLDTDFIQKNLASFFPVVLIFYGNILYLFPRFLQKQRYFLLVFFLLLVNVTGILLRFVFLEILMEIMNVYLLFPFDSITFWNQFRMNLLFTGVSFAYWYARQNYEIEKRQQRLEKEVLNARLKALKNQINPHFLYNTLSFLYTRSLPVSAELSGTIARLSAMLRYSLDEVEEEGKVALEKEVAHLKNFIDIHQFRFNHKLQVVFETNGSIHQHQIMPLLLITFVENAFKHGKLQDAAHPIQIKLSTTDKEIVFSVVNKKMAGLKEKSSGIGLQNVRNRLDLAYPNHYTLTIDDKSEEFSVHLKLMLHP